MHRPPNRWFRLHQLRSLAPATPAMWPIDWWTYDSAASVRITGPGQRWRCCAAPSRLSCYRERSVPLLSLASLEGDLKCQAKKKTKKPKIVYIAIIYVLLNWGHLLLIMVGRQVNTAAMGTNRLIPAVGHAHSLKVIQSPTRNWARPPRAFLDLTSDGNFAKVSTAAAPGSWTLAEHHSSEHRHNCKAPTWHGGAPVFLYIVCVLLVCYHTFQAFFVIIRINFFQNADQSDSQFRLTKIFHWN